MKKLFTLFSAVLVAAAVYAQDLPQPSPKAMVMQTFGLTDVTIEYSRPGVKGREVFGNLVPFDQLWRTGANSATKITVSTDVMIGSKELKAGSYSIFTTPGKDSWKVMFNTNASASTGQYDAANNAVEIEVKPMTAEATERLMFSFRNVTDNTTDVHMNWATTAISFEISADASAQAEKNIKAEIAKVEGAYGVYNSSARYYYDNDKDLEQALAWSKKSVEISAKFWNVYTLSLIQHKMGDTKNALKTAEQSLKLSEEAKYGPYIKMNKENIAAWSEKKK
jgi:tetratricopeptide (TPR) repeat protein